MSLGKKLFTGGPPPVYDFAATTYTGNGSTNSITTGLQPDLVFLRNADTTQAYLTAAFDSTRGATKLLGMSSTSAETTDSTSLTSFNSNGFTLGSGGDFNGNGNTYSSFSLKANGGTTSSNTDGNVTTTVQVNQNAGFSIVKLENHSGSYTAGHGLNGVPDLIITRVYSAGSNAIVYHSAIGARNFMNLTVRNGNTVATAGYEYDSVTSTTFTNLISFTTLSYIHYCFKSVAGLSKFGSYTGNASTNAITVGFLPKVLMIKKSSGFGTWYLYLASGMTTQSYGYSGNSGMALAGTATMPSVEFRSDNGGQFVVSGSDFNVNENGATFTYWCFGGDKTNVT